jgi:Tol biopolymer transport system component
MNIWVVTRRADGTWSEPTLVGAPVSVPHGRDIHNVVVGDGTMFVASSRPGGAGRSDIYRVSADGAIERLGPPINDAQSQPDLYVSPDGRRMILVVTDAEGGLGGDDLYVSTWRDGAWTTPRNLGAPINSSEYEYGPSISPDGRWLYFTSHRRGSADIYRVPVDQIPFGP